MAPPRAKLARCGAKMAPPRAKLARCWGQNGAKVVNMIDPKIDQFVDASWGRFLDGGRSTSGSKIRPSWYQNGIENRCYLRMTIFQKSCSGYSGGSIIQAQGVEVGSKQ